MKKKPSVKSVKSVKSVPGVKAGKENMTLEKKATREKKTTRKPAKLDVKLTPNSPPVKMSPEQLELLSGGIGAENAVQYPLTLPGGRIIMMDRFLQWTGPKGGLQYDPVNLRLHTALIQNGLDPTQENLAALLANECKELIPSLRVSGGLHAPVLLDYIGKFVKEGNRRLYSFRQLRQENESFDVIPVEKPAEPVTEDEMDLILLVRHCVRPKPWESREQGRMAKKMVAKMGISAVGLLIGRDDKQIEDHCTATDYYDHFDAWKDAHPKLGNEKSRNKDWFTYFLKIASRKKFVNNTWNLPEEREKLYRMMVDGQFNDCLNIDQIGKVWENPTARKSLEDGVPFNDCLRAYNKDMTVRRGEDGWPHGKKFFNFVKKFTGPQKKRLALEEGASDLIFLEKLGIQLQLLQAEVRGIRVISGNDTGRKAAQG